MALPLRRRRGMQLGMKFLIVLLAVGFLFLLIHSIYAANVQDELKRGFAEVDASRIYTSVDGLLGEQSAVTAIDLRNSYGSIAVGGNGVLTMEAGYRDKQLRLQLPRMFSYTQSSLEGGSVCIIKQGKTISLSSPPCEV